MTSRSEEARTAVRATREAVPRGRSHRRSHPLWTAVGVWLATVVIGCGVLYLAVAPQLMAERRERELPGASTIAGDSSGWELWVFVPVLIGAATLVAYTTTRTTRGLRRGGA